MQRQIQVSFIDAIKRGFVEKYCCFKGRASRSEFWWMWLVNLVISVAVIAIEAMTGVDYLRYLVSLFLLLPMLGVLIRRLHDVGKGGGWFLIAFVPLANLMLIFWVFKESDPFDNRFGPIPDTIEVD